MNRTTVFGDLAQALRDNSDEKSNTDPLLHVAQLTDTAGQHLQPLERRDGRGQVVLGVCSHQTSIGDTTEKVERQKRHSD